MKKRVLLLMPMLSMLISMASASMVKNQAMGSLQFMDEDPIASSNQNVSRLVEIKRTTWNSSLQLQKGMEIAIPFTIG